MFKDYTEDELAGIKAKYGTPGDVLEAPMMIGLKGVDMMRHCINVCYR
ncbi:MAG: hypothetical protein HY730_08170 [Candidatus Tectomicrobia bacterium]|uniref:Uncharacterized protein n=1 Tax=Tectimicrobiota bacterium TaxID=2528274 RepID=A0A933GP85_UNCTE|nr:hypothetical protein [Candidatus Tectomicrobia bacterium]